jgi:hypothetical protein
VNLIAGSSIESYKGCDTKRAEGHGHVEVRIIFMLYYKELARRRWVQ